MLQNCANNYNAISVSYTHLDVYKRQNVIYFIKKISAVKIMECIELDNKIKITDVHDLDLAPVSYTHLDVYKRQVIMNATSLGGTSTIALLNMPFSNKSDVIVHDLSLIHI